MDTEKVYTTSLRLYKSRPVHHQAYRYLKEYNKDIFKTKDDFIAEAIVYFAKYLQQEEEVQQMKLLNTLLENQKEQFCKIVKEAVSKAQEEAFEKLGVLEKAVQGELSDGGTIAENREKEEACMEKIYGLRNFMGHLKNKEEKDMAVGRSVWEVVKGIFIAVGKLLYLTGKLVICLFLLVLQLVLAVFHAGSRE